MTKPGVPDVGSLAQLRPRSVPFTASMIPSVMRGHATPSITQAARHGEVALISRMRATFSSGDLHAPV